MLGKLKPEQIEHVLHTSIVGRIGCHAEGQTYVVPITYAYDGSRIICHTSEGKKVKMMRKNPKVCFQVEQFLELGNWRSVIAWGRYKELSGQEATTALAFLVDQIAPHFRGQTLSPFRGSGAIRPRSKKDHLAQAIVFCIHLETKTGRFEHRGFKQAPNWIPLS